MKQRHEWIDFTGSRYIAVPSLSAVNRFDKGSEVGHSMVVPIAVVEEILRLSAEVDRLKALTSGETVWVCQDSREFFGQEVVSFKSNHNEWGYAYGLWLSGTLAIETLVVGFASEEEAFQAAHKHCYESAEESAADYIEGPEPPKEAE